MGPETETELEQEVAAEEAAALELGELAPALELEQPRPKARPMPDFRLATILNQVSGIHPVHAALARAEEPAMNLPAPTEVERPISTRKSKAERRAERRKGVES